MIPLPRPDRIVVLVSFANLAGAQIAALRLARGLRARGYNPSVHFLYEQVPVERPDHAYDVILPTPHPGTRGYAEIVRRLARLLRRERPDTVLSFLPLANVLGQSLARAQGIPRRIISHRMPAHTAKPLLRHLDTLLAYGGGYTHVVAVSESVRRTLQHYPRALLARTTVVNNGLFGWTASRLSRVEARARLGIDGEQTVLVAVGRFVEQKNYPFLLNLMARMDDDVLLLVAGDGPLRRQIEAQRHKLGLGARVRLLGNVDRTEMPDLLRAADLFVQTSTYEGQSNSVIEAMTAGLPVLVHDVPEQREAVMAPSGCVAGALLPLNALDAWAAAIAEFRHHPERAAQARAAARERARAFSYEAMIDGFERALTS